MPETVVDSAAAAAATATTATATEAPAATPAPEGGTGGAWYDTLPADMTSAENKPFLTKFKNGNDQVRAHMALERQMGGRVAIPKDTDKPEVWDAFYQQIGRPGKPEEYGEYAPPKDLPWDKNAEKNMLPVFHKAGLTKAQAVAVMNGYALEMGNAVRQMESEWAASQEKAWTELRSRWGVDTDSRVALIHRAMEIKGGPGLVAALNKSGLGNDPYFLEFAHGYAQTMVEDNILKPDLATKSNETLQAELTNLMNGKAYWTRDDPAHADTVERVAQINRLLYPSQG